MPAGVFMGGPAFRADGKEIVFFSDVSGIQGSLDIFRAAYDESTMSFGKPVAFPAPINSEEHEGFPSISPDGNTLFFVRDALADMEEVDEEDCYEIMKSEKKEDDSWSSPVALSTLNQHGCVGYPRIMPDGETLIYSMFHGEGLYDLYRVQKEDGGWSDPVAMTSLNSKADDKMLSVTYNGKLAAFSRSVEGEDIFDEDKLVTASGRLVDNVAGWAYVKTTMVDTDEKAVSGTLTIRDNSSRSDTAGITIPVGGLQLIRLRAGKEYLLTFSAPDHDFVSREVNLMNTLSPDTSEMDVILTPLKKETTIRLDKLTFEYNSAEITDSASTVLDIAALFLSQNGSIKVEIAAHTDDVGSPEFNQDLSERRAASVVQALVLRGADASRLIPRGYGESQPIADNSTEEGQAQNRRVEFKILEE
ncbi:MAG: OmpA family protein [Bacteroidia bacterium]|nr:OmpA family protein [Bacteroidia bacterium]